MAKAQRKAKARLEARRKAYDDNNTGDSGWHRPGSLNRRKN